VRTKQSNKKPPIRCTPCRVLIGDNYWRVYSDGSVSMALTRQEAENLGLRTAYQIFEYEKSTARRLDPHSTEAKTIRWEAARIRRNRNTRERNQAKKDLELVRAKDGAFGGWE